MKDKKGITVTDAFLKILDRSRRKRGFCNRSMKSSLQDNDIEIYSTHREGKSKRLLLLLKDLLEP